MLPKHFLAIALPLVLNTGQSKEHLNLRSITYWECMRSDRRLFESRFVPILGVKVRLIAPSCSSTERLQTRISTILIRDLV